MDSNKKLERDPFNRVIGGVCSGLADYFNIDIALVRVLFVVALFCGSFGFWLYLILWIVLPEKQVDYYFGGSRQQTYSGTDSGQNESQNGGSNPSDTQNYDFKAEERRRRGTIVSGAVLVIIGLAFLLNSFYPLRWLWKLWPLLVIVIGILIIVNSQNKKRNE